MLHWELKKVKKKKKIPEVKRVKLLYSIAGVFIKSIFAPLWI